MLKSSFNLALLLILSAYCMESLHGTQTIHRVGGKGSVGALTSFLAPGPGCGVIQLCSHSLQAYSASAEFVDDDDGDDEPPSCMLFF